uniref:(northern house mosquito) hypothetical protein n=1 Tax=Culex pipiens TaxID=7175 RepID=A0A8D8CJ13_CULPI
MHEWPTSFGKSPLFLSQVLQLKSPQSSRVASIIGAHVLPAFRMFIFIIICVCPHTNTHGPKLRSFLTRFFNNTCFTSYRFCILFILHSTEKIPVAFEVFHFAVMTCQS